MKNIMKLKSKADDDILDELIAACESKMSSKFKKEEPEEEIEVDVINIEEAESESDDDELDEEKMRKLLELYKSIKE